MNIEIDLNRLKRSGLNANQYVVLYLMYYKNFKLIKELFSVSDATAIRNSLIDTEYILDKTSDQKFTQTIISTSNVCKLLGIRTDKIKFNEFYGCYPIRVQNRVLRAANIDTVQGLKHEKKYLLKIKTYADHEAAVKAITVFVEKQRTAGQLAFLPNMETVLNNALWESWSEFISEFGEEGSNWQTDSI
jgi:hypothetical protein|tara:strand:- start:36163 stop:36729 length:567 start_codon:yes stop_codon:yes gene_type:complete